MPTYQIETTFSGHDGGWYAEVYEVGTGRTVHTTGTYGDRLAAKNAARRWVESLPDDAAGLEASLATEARREREAEQAQADRTDEGGGIDGIPF
jgi:hypothetical protein